jgi:hypothetical protein
MSGVDEGQQRQRRHSSLLRAQVETLRRVWLHHYHTDEHGTLRWREGSALPSASLRFDSPYDVDAHWCVKRSTELSGYRVHLTET